MNTFYFNNCLPVRCSDADVIIAFTNTFVEYDKLKQKFSKDVEGIVTINEIGEVHLNETAFTLKHCIENQVRSMRVSAYGEFTRYPVEAYFPDADEDEMILKDFFLTVEEQPLDAYYLKIVSKNKGIAFTPGLCNDLTKHPLSIVASDGDITFLNNLYGKEENTKEIEAIVIDSIRAKLGNFDRLLHILDDPSFSSKFKNAFEGYSADVQNSILSHFDKAVSRNGPTKLFSDGDLIKNVTPEKEHEISVFELRIFDPIALRVYFFEKDNHIILGSLEKKPTKKGRTTEQDNHIKSAKSTIKQIILIEKMKKKN